MCLRGSFAVVVIVKRLAMVMAGATSGGSLGPATRFSACEGHLRSLVYVLVLVKLELERHLQTTAATGRRSDRILVRRRERVDWSDFCKGKRLGKSVDRDTGVSGHRGWV